MLKQAIIVIGVLGLVSMPGWASPRNIGREANTQAIGASGRDLADRHGNYWLIEDKLQRDSSTDRMRQQMYTGDTRNWPE